MTLVRHVVDVTEVPTGLTIPEDFDFSTVLQFRNPPWYDGRVRSIGILTWTENVKISQSNGPELIPAGEAFRVDFIGSFRGRIG